MFAKFDEQLIAMKAIAIFMPKLRPDVRALEKSMREITDSVDGFYKVLKGRDWVYHDQLSITEMRESIDAGDVEALEALLIALYSDPTKLTRMLDQLRFLPNMPERMHLLELAREDHLAGRYYSTTLTLLTVMDGFVNEIEKARRGLSSRDALEIRPWNSVVGHHGGLKAAHRSFTKTFKATSNDEIFTLHRNGIVHGNLTHFNNSMVASKAWNRLFAVADWARSLEAAKAPPEPAAPPIRESLKHIAATAVRVERLNAWVSRSVSLDADGATALAAEPVAQAAAMLFESWRDKNYGSLAPLLRESPKKRELPKFAGEVRRRFESTALEGFTIEQVQLLTSSSAVVTASLTVNGVTYLNETRWLREGDGPQRRSIPEFESGGEWRSVHYYPDEYGVVR
jgi:hypothetical protein